MKTMKIWMDDLQALGRELEAGMAALAGCRLAEFETRHQRQGALCHRLQQRTAQPFAAMSGSGGAEEQRLASQVRAAADRVSRLNRQYAAFLRHAGRLLQARLTLERSLAGQLYPRQAKPRVQPSWSCEA